MKVNTSGTPGSKSGCRVARSGIKTGTRPKQKKHKKNEKTLGSNTSESGSRDTRNGSQASLALELD